eukprot:2162538-Prymnesium_polylepis.1
MPQLSRPFQRYMRSLQPDLNLTRFGGRWGLSEDQCLRIIAPGYARITNLRTGHPSCSHTLADQLGTLAPWLHTLHLWDHHGQQPQPLTLQLPAVVQARPALIALGGAFLISR